MRCLPFCSNLPRAWNCVVVRSTATVVCVPHGAREDSQPYTCLHTHTYTHAGVHILSMIAWQFVWHGCFCFVLCCGSTHALEPSQGRDRHQDVHSLPCGFDLPWHSLPASQQHLKNIHCRILAKNCLALTTRDSDTP